MTAHPHRAFRNGNVARHRASGPSYSSARHAVDCFRVEPTAQLEEVEQHADEKRPIAIIRRSMF
jgi:hypothetical protein